MFKKKNKIVQTFETQAEREQDFADYLSVALSEYHGGFSKGTANVSPSDVKKLHGLLDHYSKMEHPFTACVRDNRKRFGSLTEKYCAVIKDLIEGNTEWRGNNKKVNLSESTLKELYTIDIPEGFLHALSEWEPDFTQKEAELSEPVWNPSDGQTYLTNQLNSALNINSSDVFPLDRWVIDINTKDEKALVCSENKDYFVVPFEIIDENEIALAEEEDWVAVNDSWAAENVAFLSERNEIVAEVYLTDTQIEEKEGLIWKTIAREGTWKYSPGAGGRPVAKPLTFVKSGKSDPSNFVVSIEELKQNFDDGVKQHVTVPLSHDDKVHENTGFIRKMEVVEDSNGKALLKAGIEFTEPEIKEKIKRGSIADISSGIKFEYIKKDIGKKFNAIVDHAALTNSPWLNGMPGFSLSDSDEKLEILAFSEEVNEIENKPETLLPQGGDNEVPEVETNTFLTDLGLSEDEIKARLAEYDSLKAEHRRIGIDSKVAKWQEDGVSPALALAAKSILEADEGVAVLNLSEDGSEKTLTASDIVERLITAAPKVNLVEDVITDKEIAGDAPENDTKKENEEAEMSLAEKSLAYQLYFEEGFSKEDAAKEAKIRLADSK